MVDSQPCIKEQIKDKVTRRVRAFLNKRLYLYIVMTLPQHIDKYQKSTADWPRLKVGFFIVDELKPNLSYQRAEKNDAKRH